MKSNENPGMAVCDDSGRQITTYREMKVGNHLFHVTSIYLGKIELSTALENLAISKILEQGNMNVAEVD